MDAALPAERDDCDRLLFQFAGIGVVARLVASKAELTPPGPNPPQFYDRECINEQIRMQRNLSPLQAADMAKRMGGVEYQLHHAQQVCM